MSSRRIGDHQATSYGPGMRLVEPCRYDTTVTPRVVILVETPFIDPADEDFNFVTEAVQHLEGRVGGWEAGGPSRRSGSLSPSMAHDRQRFPS